MFSTLNFREIPLRILGWSPLKEGERERLFSSLRSILVFSHTSYFDTLIFLLYCLSDPLLYRRMVAIINQTEYNRYKYLFEYFCPNHFIPVTPINNQNNKDRGGSTNIIIDNLNKRDSFLFFISPEGTLDPAPWKSGYYNIAKATNSTIQSVGLDYEKQSIFVGDLRYPTSREEVEPLLQRDMYNVVPYVPEASFTPVRPHNKNNIAIIPTRIIIALVSILSIFLNLLSILFPPIYLLDILLNSYLIYLSSTYFYNTNNKLIISLIIFFTHVWSRSSFLFYLVTKYFIIDLSYNPNNIFLDSISINPQELVFALLVGLL